MSDARRAVWIVGAVCVVSLDHGWHTAALVFLALMALTPWKDL